jgi:hypothetical protein
LPYTVLIGADGKVRKTYLGASSSTELKADLAKLKPASKAGVQTLTDPAKRLLDFPSRPDPSSNFFRLPMPDVGGKMPDFRDNRYLQPWQKSSCCSMAPT